MRSACSLFKKFLVDEQGLETVEYAVIAGLIVAGAIATIAAIGLWVAARFEQLEAALQSGGGGGGTPTP